MIGVNDRRRIKPDKGILEFLKINDVKGIVNCFTILLVLSITVQDWPECKNHTQFETKMTKIDTLFLTKMSLKNHTL